MNALVLEQGGESILIDCGVTFDDRGIGVDVVHPDFTALENTRVRGVVLTHGHEDHIGALPYFLRRFDVPVWGPPYALGLVRERLAEHEVLGWAKLHPDRAASGVRGGTLSGRARPGDSLDCRRDRARHPDAGGDDRAHGRLQVRRRAHRRRGVRRRTAPRGRGPRGGAAPLGLDQR